MVIEFSAPSVIIARVDLYPPVQQVFQGKQSPTSDRFLIPWLTRSLQRAIQRLLSLNPHKVIIAAEIYQQQLGFEYLSSSWMEIAHLFLRLWIPWSRGLGYMTLIFDTFYLASNNISPSIPTLLFIHHRISLRESHYQECSSWECPNNKGCPCCLYESCRNIYLLPGMICAFDNVPDPRHDCSCRGHAFTLSIDDFGFFLTTIHTF